MTDLPREIIWIECQTENHTNIQYQVAEILQVHHNLYRTILKKKKKETNQSYQGEKVETTPSSLKLKLPSKLIIPVFVQSEIKD